MLEDSPINVGFGLSYASYFCVPRLVLEKMPIEWQKQFIKLAQEIPDTGEYQCLKIDKNKKFISDSFKDYRRGKVPQEWLDADGYIKINK